MVEPLCIGCCPSVCSFMVHQAASLVASARFGAPRHRMYLVTYSSRARQPASRAGRDCMARAPSTGRRRARRPAPAGTTARGSPSGAHPHRAGADAGRGRAGDGGAVAGVPHHPQPRQRARPDRGHRGPRDRPAAGDRHPRHRPLGRLDDRARGRGRRAGLRGGAVGAAGGPRDARHRVLVGAVNGAVYVWGRLPHPVHRHPRHPQRRPRPRPVALRRPADSGMPDDHPADRRRLDRLAAVLDPARRRPGPARAAAHHPAGLGPLDLRRRRQPGRRPAGRHPGQRRAHLGVRPQRTGRRHRRRASPRAGSTPARRPSASSPSSTRSPPSSSAGPASSAAAAPSPTRSSARS